MVLILESRSHLDLGDLPNLLAAELGVMTVRLERAIRSLDGVARVHVNRWGDGSAHLHMWFLARPYGRLQLRGTFLSLWDSILPPISESQWRENLAHVAAWLAEFGGRPLAEPPRIQWQTPSSIAAQSSAEAAAAAAAGDAVSVIESEEEIPLPVPTEGSTGAEAETGINTGTASVQSATASAPERTGPDSAALSLDPRSTRDADSRETATRDADSRETRTVGADDDGTADDAGPGRADAAARPDPGGTADRAAAATGTGPGGSGTDRPGTGPGNTDTVASEAEGTAVDGTDGTDAGSAAKPTTGPA
ncbi:hypothetical protein [Micromonospora antibiotica]|uniref:hypothetical protein n=1 Tax=Micromonospora antibiotica TaxID=2807623 RepID=UPI001FC9CA0C|nr:hypothetical protein [Micromonospora antibiotica]